MTDVAPLVTQRQSEGLTVKVVDVQDVFDEFSNPLGSYSSDAIKSFIQYAEANWTLKPKYVLLAGGATMDPRNYINLGQPDAIPTTFFDAINPPEVASDTALADTNGDGKVDVGIGRLPVYTDAQANALVSKIVSYAGSPLRSPTALLAADNFSRHDYCFGDDQSAQYGVPCPSTPFSEDLAGVLTGDGATVDKVYRSSATYPTDTDAHNAILAKASGAGPSFVGPTIVNWFGHGAFQSWTNGAPPLLRNQDVVNITNTGGLSVYMMMTCQTGYFVDPTTVGLGEQLLYSANGAVAAWASTGDTVPYDQVAAAKVAAHQLVGLKARFGDAMVAAMAAISDPDVLHSWALLGDPSMKLRIP
jgi:hypothetical protein